MRSNYLVKNGMIPGIVCCNTASGLLGMSRCSDWKFDFFANIPEEINSTYIRYIPLADNEIIQTQKVGNLTVTTPFQTIMDLIRYDGDIEFICESLEWWKDNFGGLTDIITGLKDRGLYNKYIEFYLPYYEDSVYL